MKKNAKIEFVQSLNSDNRKLKSLKIMLIEFALTFVLYAVCAYKKR